MKKYSTFLLLIILSSCVGTSGVMDEKMSNKVPDDSSVFIIHTDKNNQKLFDDITKQLIRDGHRIEADSTLLTIETEGKDVGQSTLARYTLFIEDGNVTGRADWKPGTEAAAMAEAMSGMTTDFEWDQAGWTKGRPKRAYASLVSFMMQFEHLTYDFN